MKKILTLIVALVIFTGMADAQISIKKSDYKTAQQVTTLSMYWNWIYKQGETYFLVMKSDNEFDEFQKASGFKADGKDGDIRVYKKDKFYGAMAVDDGIIVVVGYNNRADAIDMAKSIEFTK